MSTLKLKGSTSGYVELTAPATAGDNTITLPTTAGTVAVKDASNNTEVGTGVTIGSPSSNTFTVSTNGSERVRVDSSGRLGVGTASPATTIDAQSAQAFLQLKSTSGTNLAGVQFVPGGQTNALYIYADGSRNINFDDHATTLMSVRAAASGGGLTFNGDTAAANALDDYEEGTWTPVVGGTATYGTRSGTYTKIGNRVMLTGRINISSIGTGSQNEITGLPFTAASITSNYGGSPAFFTSLAISVVSLTPLVEPGTASIFFNTLTAGATASSNKQNVMQNGTVIDFNITYIAA